MVLTLHLKWSDGETSPPSTCPFSQDATSRCSKVYTKTPMSSSLSQPQNLHPLVSCPAATRVPTISSLSSANVSQAPHRHLPLGLVLVVSQLSCCRRLLFVARCLLNTKSGISMSSSLQKLEHVQQGMKLQCLRGYNNSICISEFSC